MDKTLFPDEYAAHNDVELKRQIGNKSTGPMHFLVGYHRIGENHENVDVGAGHRVAASLGAEKHQVLQPRSVRCFEPATKPSQYVPDPRVHAKSPGPRERCPAILNNCTS